MRATPIPARHGTGRRMPTPTISKKIVSQSMDLKPMGNTVSVTALADNPFEQRKRISIHTQASGGYPGVPESMRSRRLQHEMLPGMGDETDPQTQVAAANDEPGILDTLITSARDFGTTREARRLEEARAKQARYEAQAAAAEAEADIARSRVDEIRAGMARGVRATSVDTGLGFKVNVPLLLGGIALIGGAYVLSKKGKKRR